MVTRPCDEDCNRCPLLREGNARILTVIFNELNERFGDGVYAVVQGACPNLTVCFDCRIDDFCHVEGCELLAAALANAAAGKKGRVD